jgi:predicted transcriptional regulator
MNQVPQLLNATTSIVTAHVAHNRVEAGQLPELIRKVHEALRSVRGASAPAATSRIPIVSVKSSVKRDYIACLVCGGKFTSLRRHLRSKHGITREEYRSLYGLPKAYPLTSLAYAERRRQIASGTGLGRRSSQ